MVIDLQMFLCLITGWLIYHTIQRKEYMWITVKRTPVFSSRDFWSILHRGRSISGQSTSHNSVWRPGWLKLRRSFRLMGYQIVSQSCIIEHDMTFSSYLIHLSAQRRLSAMLQLCVRLKVCKLIMATGRPRLSLKSDIKHIKDRTCTRVT